jgi:hypothetical protein
MYYQTQEVWRFSVMELLRRLFQASFPLITEMIGWC